MINCQQLIIVCIVLVSALNNTYASDWCKNKPVDGKFTLSENCGVHRLSGECVVNGDHHHTAICIFHAENLEIQGITNGDNEGNLPQIYRRDHTRPYRIFTVSGGAQLTLRNIGVKFGNVSALGTTGQHIGVGGGIYCSNSNVFLYDSVLSSNIANGIGGGGAYVGTAATLTAYKTLFFKNQATNGDGVSFGGRAGGIYCGSTTSYCWLNASDVLENIASTMGGGMYCSKLAHCNVCMKTVISQNEAPIDPGVSVDTRVPAFFTDGTSYINSLHCMPGTTGGPLNAIIMTDKNRMKQPKNSAICTACPKGKYTQDTKTCEDCESGKFTNDIGNSCTNITVKKSHHRSGGNSNGHASIHDEGTIISNLENPSNFWNNVLYGVCAIISLFLIYKICLFIWLKCSGRLNPDMPGWKSFLFTILYGSSLDAHMLPKEGNGVALKSINGNEQSLLYQNLENNEGDEL